MTVGPAALRLGVLLGASLALSRAAWLWLASAAPAGLEARLEAVPTLPPAGVVAGKGQDESAESNSVAHLLTRLAAAPDDELGELLQAAFDTFLRESTAMHLPEAEALAVAMHARAQAGWSALTLALLSSRLGDSERAERVLREQYERTTDPAQRVELIERRAIAALGAGQRERGLDLLGLALVLGGRDAQQMLGRDALARRDYGRARQLFAALLPAATAGRAPYDAGNVPAWALRGWGLALLGAQADPVGPAAR